MPAGYIVYGYVLFEGEVKPKKKSLKSVTEEEEQEDKTGTAQFIR